MLSILQGEFAGLAGVQSGYDCIKNGIHNTALATYIGLVSRILYVETPSGFHAYVADERNAWSRGLTWHDDLFPELTLEEIGTMGGRDVTKVLFWQAFGIGGDVHNHHVVTDNLAKVVPEVVNFLINVYQLE